jgi:hypothetical protein
MNPADLETLLPPLERIEELDLDALREHLKTAAQAWSETDSRCRLYETELQRELRAKIELAGPIPSCGSSEKAYTLSGTDLLAARHEAAQKFNEVFCMAPLSRHAARNADRSYPRL